MKFRCKDKCALTGDTGAMETGLNYQKSDLAKFGAHVMSIGKELQKGYINR